MNFIEELTWRGMVHQSMPGTDEYLKKGMTSAYLGIDPTAARSTVPAEKTTATTTRPQKNPPGIWRGRGIVVILRVIF